MKNKVLLHIFLIGSAMLLLPALTSAQTLSTLMKAIANNGKMALQVSNQSVLDSLFIQDTSNQITLDFYFTPNDLRNGAHTGAMTIQALGDVYMTFQDVPSQTGDSLTFTAAQYALNGDLIRAFTFINGDYWTGPDGLAPPACPVSITCSTNFLTIGFNPQDYQVQKTRTMTFALSFGTGSPYNGVYQSNGVNVATNVIYVRGDFNCAQMPMGDAVIIFDGLTCGFEGNGPTYSPSCSPYGNYYTPGDVCAEYFENCVSKLLTPLVDKRTELPCRQWKEYQNSTCSTNSYIYRTGKVSIGTVNQAPRSSASSASDKAMLSVKNGIITDKVKVKLCESTWCDYVFDEGYPLRSMPATEAYIFQNCHLPGMPSGGTIEAEGAFDLGDITRLQQEKIEEIYLHLIALQNEVELMEAELGWLQAKAKMDRK